MEEGAEEGETEEDMMQSPVLTQSQGTRSGAKTSDFYSVKNIPERFNHPGELCMCTMMNDEYAPR